MKIVMKTFKTIINEEKNYLVLKESIRMMKTQRSDRKDEQSKRKDIDEITKQNARV